MTINIMDIFIGNFSIVFEAARWQYYSYIFYSSMKLIYTLVGLCLLLIQIHTSLIEGSWKLTSILENQLQVDQQPEIQIKNFIFRKKTLRWSFSMLGCSSLRAMMDLRGRNIFVDLSTIYIEDNTTDNNCSSRIANRKKIQAALRKAFSFQIIQNFMIFSDPDGKVLLKFEKPAKNLKPFLLGVWISKFTGSREGQIIEIREDVFRFCEKQVEVRYNVTNNKIEFDSNRSIPDSCKSNQLLKYLNSSLYLAKRNTTIQLYNPKDDIEITLKYVMDLETAAKIEEQQSKTVVQQNEVPKPEIKQDKGLLKDLIGKWEISRVFTELSILPAIVFIVTESSLILAGTCNTFTYEYSSAKAIGQSITVRRTNFKQTINNCSNDDENLYKLALSKVAVITPRRLQNKVVVKIFDKNQTEVLEIFRDGVPENNSQVTAGPKKPVLPSSPLLLEIPMAPRAPQAPPSVLPPPPSSSSLLSGRYTILLLKRRDLPRKIFDLIDNSFRLRLCNEYLVTALVNNQKISLRLSPTTQNPSCSSSTDSVYINALEEAVSFRVDGQDYVGVSQDKEDIFAFLAI